MFFDGKDGPDVSCSDSQLMVEKGTALKDVCNVTGNPIPSVQWLKDGKEASSSIPLTENEYGNYTLIVDGFERIERNFTILVQCKCAHWQLCLILVAFKIRHAVLNTLNLIRLSNHLQQTLSSEYFVLCFDCRWTKTNVQ